MIRLNGWTAAAALALLATALPVPAQVGGYGGGGGFGGNVGGQFVDTGSAVKVPVFRPWLAVNGSYVRPLDDVSRTIGAGGTGSSFIGGVALSKALERTSLVGGYVIGGYLQSPFRNTNVVQRNLGLGISHVGTLQVIHQVSQRVAFAFRGFGGSSNGGYGAGAGFSGIGGFAPAGLAPSPVFSQGQLNSPNLGLGFQDPGFNGVVDNELFDARVNFMGANVGVSYSPDQRNVFQFSGGGNIVRRSLDYLVGLNSYGASAGYMRRISQRLGTGFFYNYGRFEYPGFYGGNNMHTGAFQMQYTISPRSNFELYGGVFNFQSKSIGTIQLPPQMALLLGQTTVQEVRDINFYSFAGGVNYNYGLRVGGIGLGYQRGGRPGNGFLFPTVQDTIFASYAVGSSRISYTVAAYGSKGSSIGSIRGETENASVISFVGFRIVGGLHGNVSAGHRWVKPGPQPMQRYLFASVGIAFAPGSFPLWF